MIIAGKSKKSTPNRPPPSPLLRTWTRAPQAIQDSISDAAASIEVGRAMKRELDGVARGELHPDRPGLATFWSYAGLNGCPGLLTEQRRWHEQHGRGGGR